MTTIPYNVAIKKNVLLLSLCHSKEAHGQRLTRTRKSKMRAEIEKAFSPGRGGVGGYRVFERSFSIIIFIYFY